MRFTGNSLRTVALAGVLGATLSYHAGAVTVTEYPIPTAINTPTTIALGSDGALWFTGQGPAAQGATIETIGRVTGAGAFTTYPLPFPPGPVYYPGFIISGSDGALWFTALSQTGINQLEQITTAGAITAKLPLGGDVGPGGIVTGPDGAVWVASRIDPRHSAQIVRVPVDGSAPNYYGIPFQPDKGPYPIDVAAGSDGALWFTGAFWFSSDHFIGRITTAGAVTTYPLPAGSGAGGITAGPDGALWFTEGGSAFGSPTSANKIGRITTSGAITEYPIPTANAGAFYITTGPDGALWFTEATANQIGRITTNGVITEYPIPTPNSKPGGITSGPDGALWFTETGANKIGRLVPDSTTGGGSPSDLAQGKAATQSSTYLGYSSAAAGSAVDGNTDGAFFDNSVTATNLQPNPWWQVDLGASASISSIAIWNRTDCCTSRLSDYWVFVSDTPFSATDTPATLQNRPGTLAFHETSAPAPSSTIPVNAQGRYVRVQLSTTDYMSLAEVQVLGTGGAPPPSNLAQGRAATQSSTYPTPSAVASSAVDGNTDGSFFDGSVTATNLEASPWWQVDLGASPTVQSITISNRTDCCGDRLSDYWVFVSNTPFLPTDTPATLQNRAGIFASHQTTSPNPSTSIPVNFQGRYVRVQLSGTGYLSLAEVQVFGSGGAPPPVNQAMGKPATQSSSFYTNGAGAAVAVDGNTDGNFFDGSVTATGLDPNPWWQVDLGTSPTINSVVLWNRTDCCASRLSDYWVFVSNTPFLATDTPATLQNRAGTFAVHQAATPNPSSTIPVGAQGRYVRVQLSSAGYLSLAEVQVFGQ